MSMKHIIRGVGMIAACVLAVGLAMCLGGGVPVVGWLLGYMTALAFVSAAGLWAWIA